MDLHQATNQDVISAPSAPGGQNYSDSSDSDQKPEKEKREVLCNDVGGGRNDKYLGKGDQSMTEKHGLGINGLMKAIVGNNSVFAAYEEYLDDALII